MTVCKCVPFFHTMGYNESLNITICSGTTLACMNKILGDIGSHTHVKDKDGNSKQCYSPCTDQVSIVHNIFSTEMKSVFTLGNNCITIGLVDIRYPVVRLLLLKNPILSSSFLFCNFCT